MTGLEDSYTLTTRDALGRPLKRFYTTASASGNLEIRKDIIEYRAASRTHGAGPMAGLQVDLDLVLVKDGEGNLVQRMRDGDRVVWVDECDNTISPGAGALTGVMCENADSSHLTYQATGVTKAAVYHQYRTKEEIILAVAEVVMAGLEDAVAAAEAERSRARARDVLIARMVDLAVERRTWAGVLQRDPVMLRCLRAHARFRRVMERVNRGLMGGAPDPRRRMLAAALAATIAGAVIHPLVVDLDDESLRAELLRHIRRIVPHR